MKVAQFVMAYLVEQDRLRAILPDGFNSLRPVLRINAEIRDERSSYVEFNTAVEKDRKRGWLNIGHWTDFMSKKDEKKTVFQSELLKISFTNVGSEGACPSEKDNEGCCFLGEHPEWNTPEKITENKVFCDCSFAWHFGTRGAHGASIGKTFPAIPTAVQTIYPKQDFTAENAATIPCKQVLGSYVVKFDR